MSRTLLCGALAALLLAGCGERTSSTGWAARVPADATRYLHQEPVPAAAPPKPTGGEPDAVAAPEPPSDPFASKVVEPTEITLMHAYRATERAALKQVIERFHALGTPVTVKLRVVPFDAFNDKIKIIIPEGRGPDVFIFQHDLIGAWSEMGFLQPLNKWTEDGITETFIPKTARALVYRKTLYGLPMAFKSVALFYDRGKIAAPPKTIEEMLAVAKRFSVPSEDRFGLVYEAANLYFHAPWVHAHGAQVLDADDKAHADSPQAAAALELARTFVQVHEITPPGVTTSMVSGYFNDGLAVMAINGPWMRGEIEGIDYGVAPLPALADGKPARPFLGVEAVFMNKRSPRQQAAYEVMRYLVSDEAARIRFEVGQQPVANKSIWESGEVEVDARMAAFREQAEVAVVMSSSPRMQQVWTPYNEALLSVISGNAKPAEALAAAQRRIETDMARAGGGR